MDREKPVVCIRREAEDEVGCREDDNLCGHLARQKGQKTHCQLQKDLLTRRLTH